jgi:2OG-Fe(II) oxygenase superfamily
MLIPARSLGVEDLQVVRYESSGEYTLHHDGNDRVLTLLHCLNDEGETWFPLAKQKINEVNSSSIPRTLQEALDAAQTLKPGVDGILISTFSCSQQTNFSSCAPIRRGDSVAFYSYFQDGTMDWCSIHAGLPVRGAEKIIANHFFRHVPEMAENKQSV